MSMLFFGEMAFPDYGGLAHYFDLGFVLVIEMPLPAIYQPVENVHAWRGSESS